MEINKKLLSYQIKEYISSYLTYQRNLSINTISTYSYGLLGFIEFLKTMKLDIEIFEVKDITIELVNSYIEYLNSKNLSAKTINNRITILKSFVDYVSSRDASVVETYRILKSIKKQKEPEKLHEYLTKEEIKEIMDEAKENIKYYCILSIAYECGLRVSEIYNLKKDDVILIKNDSKIIIERSKGNKTREIVLTNVVADIIKKYLILYRNNSELLFVNKYNNKYSSKGINYIFKKYYNQAKQKCNDNTMFRHNPHIHILRHSKGVHLVDNNVSLIAIRDLLGHKSIKTTEIYARISTEKKRQILEENSQTKKINIRRSEKEINELENFLKNSWKTSEKL